MTPCNTPSLVSAAALASVLAVPVSALADGVYHPAPNEAGVTYHPDHLGNKTSQQVAEELDAATKHPAWQTSMSRGAPWPVAKSAEPKTRDQVSAELQAAMKHPAWNSVSRGAPWPAFKVDDSTRIGK